MSQSDANFDENYYDPNGNIDYSEDNPVQSQPRPNLEKAKNTATKMAAMNGMYHASAFGATLLMLYEQSIYAAEKIKHRKGDTDFLAEDYFEHVDQTLEDVLAGLTETELAAIGIIFTGFILAWRKWIPGYRANYDKSNLKIDLEIKAVDELKEHLGEKNKFIADRTQACSRDQPSLQTYVNFFTNTAAFSLSPLQKNSTDNETKKEVSSAQKSQPQPVEPSIPKNEHNRLYH